MPSAAPARAVAALAVVAWLAPWLTSRGSAHELYLRPSAFSASPHDRVALALEVGHGFAGEPVERRPSHLRRFVALLPDGSVREVPGVPDTSPAGWLGDLADGLVPVSYQSHAMFHELPGERFDRYLEEEGLDAVLAARTARGEGGRPGRELFSRCAKTLVRFGETGSVGELPLAGCPLELAPGRAPLDAGAPLVVRLLFEGRPLAGALVRATREGDSTPAHAVRTDAAGVARLPLGAGAWLVHVVHMVEETGDPRADWRSVWSSLTLERQLAGPDPSSVTGGAG